MEATITKPGGLGPWFCGLFFNTCKKSKKQTHVIAHTQLSWASMYLNRQSKKVYENVGWVAVMKVGPFSSWQKAVSFVYLWTDKTRGKYPRILQGHQLFSMCAKELNLRLWIINKTYTEIIEKRIKESEEEKKKNKTRKRTRARQQLEQMQKDADCFLVEKWRKIDKEKISISELLTF